MTIVAANPAEGAERDGESRTGTPLFGSASCWGVKASCMQT